ncbi:Rieske 2Fe-2S domain-containing protein [Caballeronia sp. 15711]|uniref:Rieske 2Fe-2S domain-containing protein n=1 Tax=Caballeronia sp. 15711 TaxID=3391029 RepID=UPI0039E3D21E
MKAEDNELLTRVDGDAPMGSFLRENFWVPAVLASSLEAGGKPVRMKLVGRAYVLFRGHSGKTGCLDEACPHRGASLALARNEDDALRCVYHGWKYNTEGKMVACPTEPNDEAAFCKTVKVNVHPTHEAADIVWVWLGAGEPAPFPNFEFAAVPSEQRVSVRQQVGYNWLQGLEGTMDSAHVTVLHAEWIDTISQGRGGVSKVANRKAPRYEIEDENYGFRYVAHRDSDGGGTHARVNVFVAPWYGFICPGDAPDGDRTAIFTVPCDDVSNLHFMVRYNPFKPLTSYYFTRFSDPNDWPPLPPGGPDESWGQDRALMKRGGNTGFTNITTEDFAVGLSMGPIVDRTKEHLNSGDLAVVRLRRQLLSAVKSFQAGDHPEIAQTALIDFSVVRPVAEDLKAGEDWRTLT